MVHWHWEATLISYLTSRQTVLPFRNIPELVWSTHTKIAIVLGTADEDAFKISTDPYWMKAWKERIEPNIDEYKGKNIEDFINLIKEDANYALYDNYYQTATYDAFTECKILATPGRYDFKPYAFGFQKDSPFLPAFNFFLRQLIEKGSLKQILDNYEHQPQNFPDSDGKPVGFGACFTAFVILFCGAGIALS